MQMIDRRVNSPLTSSCGRLFDAVAALVGLRTTINYEAQAAIELEMAAHDSSDEGAYPFELQFAAETWIIGTRPLFEWLIRDIRRGARIQDISRRFHNGMASLFLGLAEKIRETHGLNRVCLTGGCFQNILLFELLLAALRKQNFEVYFHTEVPAGDGGISLGQALVAAHRLRNRVALS
jgi:hydrogenase maturation protein HypF